MKFAEGRLEVIREQAEQYISAKVEGVSTRDILAQIYVENLSEKRADQGYAMADSLIRCIQQFDQDYQAAKANPEKYLSEFASRIEEGKNDEQKCTLWMKVAAAVSASGAELDGGSAERRVLLAQIEQIHVAQEEATPERVQALREAALVALRNSGGMLSALREHADELEQMAGDSDIAELIIGIGSVDMEYRAVVAMLMYVGIKNNQYPESPADLTLAQTANLVCAQIERLRIAEDVGSGEISEIAGEDRMRILDLVTTCLTVAAVLAAGAGLTSSVFGLIARMPISCWIVLGALLGVGYGVKVWCQKHDIAVRLPKLSVSAVAGGLRKMAAGFSKKISEIAACAKQCFERSAGLVCAVGSVEYDALLQTNLQQMEHN